MCYVQSLNQISKIEIMKKIYKQPIEELNERLDDLSQTFKILKTPNKDMTQKSINVFVNEIYSKRPKKKYPTNKTDVYHNEGFCSLNISDLKDYGPENNRGYRYVLAVNDFL